MTNTAEETVLKQRLAALTLEQKVRLLTGADWWSLYPEPAVGLRRVVLSDGPAGVRGELWDERDQSANIPSATALAATWDEARIEAVGSLLAAEARRKGVDVLLAPTVNLHRTPYGGRHFECFSEDPLLTGRIGAAYVRGVQSGGVAATVKHFVANDAETDRFTADNQVAERVLRELYLAPFEVIVREAGAWAVMAAYNAVNGTTMTEHPMLREVLKGEWGFDGVVMTDWFAGRSTEAAGNAALDLMMPGPNSPWRTALAGAVAAGRVSADAVDDKVVRLLRLAGRVGALDGSEPPAVAPGPVASAATIAAELRATAAAGFVLARNDAGALPLKAAKLRRVAVIGPNAAVARTLGGGSATVFPPYTVSPLAGLRAALGEGVRVDYTPGVRAGTRVPPAAPELLRLPGDEVGGVEVRFLDGVGAVLGTERRTGCAFQWFARVADGVPVAQVAAVEVVTRLVARDAGQYKIGCSGAGRFRLTLDGKPAFDQRIEIPPDMDPAVAGTLPPQHATQVLLEQGAEVPVNLRYELHWENRPAAAATAISFQFNVAPPQPPEAAELDRAVALARAADVAVVVVGTTEEVESEGFDRTSLALPGRQDDLVRMVAAVNPRTVVVVNSGAPVLLPWAAEVPAILLSWFPGQEFGNALADVLLGAVEPGGRLPTTWPRDPAAPLPSPQPVAGRVSYEEGVHIGHRRFLRDGVTPLFWFGHGLGYTTWEYRAATAEPPSGRDGGVLVRVRMRNTGSRPGGEVAQVYLSRPGSAVDRPVRWLAGFARITAEPGTETGADIVLPARAFAHWDTDAASWAVEPGSYQIHVGRCAGDLPLMTQIALP